MVHNSDGRASEPVSWRGATDMSVHALWFCTRTPAHTRAREHKLTSPLEFGGRVKSSAESRKINDKACSSPVRHLPHYTSHLLTHTGPGHPA